MTLVRGRRCATSRRNSSVCGLGWIGYVSGSSTQPIDFDATRLHFERLPLRRRRHDVAGDDDRAAGGQVHDIVRVVRQRVRHDRLDRMEARAVRHVHERDAGLRVAPRADPAFQRDRRVGRRATGEDLRASVGSHGRNPINSRSRARCAVFRAARGAGRRRRERSARRGSAAVHSRSAPVRAGTASPMPTGSGPA